MIADEQDRLAERLYLRDLGRRVRLLRLTRELSQEELATLSKMSRNFISSIERGTHGVNIIRLVRIARALNVGIARIVTETDAAEQTITG